MVRAGAVLPEALGLVGSADAVGGIEWDVETDELGALGVAVGELVGVGIVPDLMLAAAASAWVRQLSGIGA